MKEEARQENQLEEIKQMKQSFVNAFSTESGKKVLADLEKLCFINRTTFPADGQALSLAKNEGMRFVVVHIKNMMNMDIKQLTELARKGD